jgi:hypothetical protein
MRPRNDTPPYRPELFHERAALKSNTHFRVETLKTLRWQATRPPAGLRCSHRLSPEAGNRIRATSTARRFLKERILPSLFLPRVLLSGSFVVSRCPALSARYAQPVHQQLPDNRKRSLNLAEAFGQGGYWLIWAAVLIEELEAINAASCPSRPLGIFPQSWHFVSAIC